MKAIELVWVEPIRKLIKYGLVFALLTAAVFTFNRSILNFNATIDENLFAAYGNFISGTVGVLFSLVGILLIIKNLKDQSDSFLKKQIEDTFFELLRIQRENSNEIYWGEIRNRRVFVELINEFNHCYTRVLPFKGQHKIENDEEIINIAYMVFFYGAIGLSAKEVLEERLAKRYGANFVNELIKAFTSAPYKKDNNSFFTGHQSRLGHYYRHLFQTVKYINDQPSLKYKEKYQYVKTLRAQLSTHEQVLFFLNSVSDLGRVWEKKPEKTGSDYQLITKYNLIKNIPSGYIKGIKTRDYYPDVFYESDETMSVKRAELELIYK
ncbi:MAG TPA: putative phage abortive infection protein [Gammaproteobacteria bacterium]